MASVEAISIERGQRTERAAGILSSSVFESQRMPDLDLVVRQQGRGIYQEMMLTEPSVKASMSYKQLAVLSSGYTLSVVEGGTQEFLDFIDEQLNRLSEPFETVLRCILLNLVFGFSVAEKVFEQLTRGRWSGLVGLMDISDKPAETFDFDVETTGRLKPHGLIQFKGALNEKRLPVRKFVIAPYQKRGGNWYGVSDFRVIYPHWFSKRIIRSAWNLSLEKFGSPIVVGTITGEETEEYLDDLLKSLEGLHHRTAMLVRRDHESVDYLEQASGSQGFGAFRASQEYNDKMISRGILIPDLLYSEGLRSGARSLGETHSESFLWILRWLGRDLAQVVNKQIIEPLIHMNFGQEAVAPVFSFNSFDRRLRDRVLDGLNELLAGGVVGPSEPWIRERLDIPPAPVQVDE